MQVLLRRLNSQKCKKRANLDSLDNVFKDLSEPWATDHYISLFDELKQPSFSHNEHYYLLQM